MYTQAFARFGRNWLKGTELLVSLPAVRRASMSSFRTSGLLPGASASESLPLPGHNREKKSSRLKNMSGL